MDKDLKNNLRQTAWYYPMVFGVVSVLLAILFTFIDHNIQHFSHYKAIMPFFISTDLAVQILNTLAVVSATILTFTFSTTMVVLTNFSSQYSPTLVENFLKDTVTLKAFGIFFGGFTYTVTSLFLLDVNLHQDKVSVASFCIVYVLVDLIFFNRFIRAVINYIHPSGLLVKLNEEARRHIDQYEALIKDKEIFEEGDLPVGEYLYRYDIQASQDGYLQSLDPQGISHIIKDSKTSAIFHHVMGDFVTEDSVLMTILSNQEFKEADKMAMKEDLLNHIDIGFVRTGDQDFLYSLQKIMDISMKSINNTVYAPNSTLASMNVIRVLLRRIASYNDGYRMEYIDDTNRKPFIAFKTLNFLQILEDIYDPVLNFGAANGIIVRYIFDSLETIQKGATPENKEKVIQYVESLQSILDHNNSQHINYHYREDYDRLMDAMK